MKKLFALVLALCMLLTCALADEAWLVGDWNLSSAEYNGIKMDASALGHDMLITLKADGVVTITMDDMSEDGTWKVDGEKLILVNENDELVCILADNSFYMEEGGGKLYFAKAASAAPAGSFDPTGSWEFVMAETGGMELSADMLGMEMTFDFAADGTLTATSEGEVEDGSWKMENGQLMIDGGNVLPGVIEGDRFYVEQEGVKMYFQRVNGDQQPASAEEDPNKEPEAVVAADITEFDGSWGNAFAFYNGIRVPLSAADTTSSMEIKNGVAHIKLGTTENILPLEFKDGVLFIQTGDTVLTITLYEGNVASLSTKGSVIYYEKLN